MGPLALAVLLGLALGDSADTVLCLTCPEVADATRYSASPWLCELLHSAATPLSWARLIDGGGGQQASLGSYATLPSSRGRAH